jgi:hypothetical protein
MRKTFILTLVLCVAAAVAYAQAPAAAGSTASTGAATTTTGTTGTTSTTTTTTKTKHAAAAKSAKGSIASVDDTAKSFTVHPKTGSDWTFKTNDKTSYWNGKKKGTWADVKQGSDVTVWYKNDGTDNWATRVKIAAPMAAAPAKTGSK